MDSTVTHINRNVQIIKNIGKIIRLRIPRSKSIGLICERCPDFQDRSIIFYEKTISFRKYISN